MLIAGRDLGVVLSVTHLGGEAGSHCLRDTAYLRPVTLVEKLRQALLLLLIVLRVDRIIIRVGICLYVGTLQKLLMQLLLLLLLLLKSFCNESDAFFVLACLAALPGRMIILQFLFNFC